jgi:hypothetical protein
MHFTPEFAQFQARWWLTAGQDTRRWAFYTLGAQMCAMDTGNVYGPVVAS